MFGLKTANKQASSLTRARILVVRSNHADAFDQESDASSCSTVAGDSWVRPCARHRDLTVVPTARRPAYDWTDTRLPAAKSSLKNSCARA